VVVGSGSGTACSSVSSGRLVPAGISGTAIRVVPAGSLVTVSRSARTFTAASASGELLQIQRHHPRSFSAACVLLERFVKSRRHPVSVSIANHFQFLLCALYVISHDICVIIVILFTVLRD
jgi:hypothetical protein